MADETNEMLASSLLALPSELRIKIWTHHFRSASVELLSGERVGLIYLNIRSTYPHTLALLQVSHQLRNEGLPLVQHIHLKLTALFTGRHYKSSSHNVINIRQIHTAHIKSIHLAFLDSNFNILKSLSALEHVYIDPAGEMSPKRPRGITAAGDIWEPSHIDAEAGHVAMHSRLMESMRLMHQLLADVAPALRCEVHFNVGFKFRVKPAIASQAGRVLSHRGMFQSVVSRE